MRLSSFMTQAASSFQLCTQASTLTELKKGVSDSVVTSEPFLHDRACDQNDPDKMLDPLGHHATTCKRGGDVVFRHRDILAETCRRAHFSVQVEAGCNLTRDHSHSRPADVLISN